MPKQGERSAHVAWRNGTIHEAKKWAYSMAQQVPGIVWTAIVGDEMFSYERREEETWPRRV